MTQQNYNQERGEVLAFLQDYIEKYAFNDFEELMKIKPDSSGLRACAVAQALAAFAIIDLFGFYVRTDLTTVKGVTVNEFDDHGLSKLKSDTSKSIKLFLGNRRYFPSVANEDISHIVSIYRNGLVHQYFSKYSGIGKPNALTKLFYKTDSGFSLNVNIFTQLVLDAINQLKLDVFNNFDTELTKRIFRRKEYLSRQDFIDNRNFMPRDYTDLGSSAYQTTQPPTTTTTTTHSQTTTTTTHP